MAKSEFKKKIKDFLIKRNIIKGKFYIESFVNIENHRIVDHPTGTLKWLEPITIECYYKDKDKLAFDTLNAKYPKYKGCIYLY